MTHAEYLVREEQGERHPARVARRHHLRHVGRHAGSRGPHGDPHRRALSGQLRGKRCRVYSSDLKVRVLATGLSTYADVSVVSGQLEVDPDDRNAALNPVVLVEVLPDSTEAFDRAREVQPLPPHPIARRVRPGPAARAQDRGVSPERSGQVGARRGGRRRRGGSAREHRLRALGRRGVRRSAARSRVGVAPLATSPNAADSPCRGADRPNHAADPANRAADPANRAADPANRAADPPNRAADPANRAADPRTAEPTLRTAEPTPRTGGANLRTAEPTPRTAEPTPERRSQPSERRS